MTIKEYVFSKNPMPINEWIQCIKKDGFSHHEDTIIQAADQFNKIIINHNANFLNAI